ncbi:MAG: 50S ribosomal protein L23 [Candidatus Woesearchaeota archaeon]
MAYTNDSYNVIKYPLSTEKAIRIMEAENKLVFMVDRKANKIAIKKAFEDMFKIKALAITTLITPKGKKKAYIKLPVDQPAIDIATKLGIM